MAGPDNAVSQAGDSHGSTVQFANSTTSVLATLAALAEVSAPLSSSDRDAGRGSHFGAHSGLCSQYLGRKWEEIKDVEVIFALFSG